MTSPEGPTDVMPAPYGMVACLDDTVATRLEHAARGLLYPPMTTTPGQRTGMRRLLLCAGIFTLLPTAGRAQERPVGEDFDRAWRDARYIVTSPFHATTSDARTAALAGGAFVLLLAADEPVHDWLRTHPGSPVHQVLGLFGDESSLNLLGRSGALLLPLSAGFYALGHITNSHDLRDAGLGCATANLTATLSRSVLTTLVGRLRPSEGRGAFVFRPLVLGDWGLRSFPGGHASNAMACASFFNERFDLGAAEPVLYGLATVVGLARLKDEAHWTSDTFAGTAYGYAVGKAVAARSLERANRREAERSMQPRLYLGWQFTF